MPLKGTGQNTEFMVRFVSSIQTILPDFVREARILELVPVAVTLLNETFSADIALKGCVRNVTHNVISHIAESECSLVAQSTDQNLVLSACVWVGK